MLAMTAPTLLEQKLYAILPKFGAFISFVSAIWIILCILLSERHKKVFHRLVVGLNFSGVLATIAIFWGTWAMDKDTPNVFMPMGNRTTCQIQGATLHYLNIVLWTYYMSFSLISYISIKNDFNEVILRKYELWIHGIILTMPTPTTIIGLKGDYFNQSDAWCWSEAYPKNCLEDESIECIRGENLQKFSLIFMPVYIATLLISTILVFCLYGQVSGSDTRSSQSGLAAVLQIAKERKLKMVARQSTLFLSVVYFFGLMQFLDRLTILSFERELSHTFSLISTTAYSFLGFFFAIVYEMLRLKDKKDDTSFLRSSFPLISTQSLTECPKPSKKTCEKESYSIFDGTTCSGKWGAFIYNDDDPESESSVILEDDSPDAGV